MGLGHDPVGTLLQSINFGNPLSLWLWLTYKDRRLLKKRPLCFYPQTIGKKHAPVIVTWGKIRPSYTPFIIIQKLIYIHAVKEYAVCLLLLSSTAFFSNAGFRQYYIMNESIAACHFIYFSFEVLAFVQIIIYAHCLLRFLCVCRQETSFKYLSQHQ